MNRKSTNKELVEILEEQNANGKYDKIIANAKSNRYHDFKNPEDVVCGKIELIGDLSPYPELKWVSDMVKYGEFDESPDEADKAEMRKDMPESMWGPLGLK